eukprot:6198691-Pleurochrysis_carterae.AAC.2
MPLAGCADLNGTASGDPIDSRFDRSYRANPTGLAHRLQKAHFCQDITKITKFSFRRPKIGP